jgi:BexC/CtrB/KpsE family polysaccharide export inner-membrane protein
MASDGQATTAELEPNPAGAESHPVLDEENHAIEVRLPPSVAGEEFMPPVASRRRHGLFIVTVVVPMAVASLFFFFLTPRYSSTASFRVRSIEDTSNELRTEQLGISVPLISEDTYSVSAYLTSRDMVEQLAKNDNLRGILSRPRGDLAFRYPTFWLPDNEEFLYRRFQWAATTKVDDGSGISTIEVNAFTPEDAQALAKAMLRYAETLVNRMNQRMYHDQVAASDRFVAEAQEKVDAIEAELRRFRDASGSVDPNLVAQSELNVIQQLSTQLAQAEASIVQQVKLAPTSPALVGLRAQVRSYRDEIERRMLEIAGAGGSEAVKLQTYDLLALRRDLAIQALTDAVGQGEIAREEAERQQLYVDLVSRPSLADWPRYPQTTFDLLAFLGICLSVFQILRKLDDIAAMHVR